MMCDELRKALDKDKLDKKRKRLKLILEYILLLVIMLACTVQINF